MNAHAYAWALSVNSLVCKGSREPQNPNEKSAKGSRLFYAFLNTQPR